MGTADFERPTNLGVLYYRERRWAESAEMTRKALDLNPNDWRAWSNLRLTYEWLKRPKEVEEATRNELQRLEEIAKISHNDAEVQVELGFLYSRQKLREKAVAYIEAALARSPDNPGLLVSAGEAYENLGERARAIELVTQALAKGWTLEQLENDPGQQQLLHDAGFQENVRNLTHSSTLLRNNNDGRFARKE